MYPKKVEFTDCPFIVTRSLNIVYHFIRKYAHKFTKFGKAKVKERRLESHCWWYEVGRWDISLISGALDGALLQELFYFDAKEILESSWIFHEYQGRFLQIRKF